MTDLARNPANHTMRLTATTVQGTAADVRKQPARAPHDEEVWTFTVHQHGQTNQLGARVLVELRGTSIVGRLADGDVHGKLVLQP